MNRLCKHVAIAFAAVFGIAWISMSVFSADPQGRPFARAEQLMKDGNFQEAFDAYRDELLGAGDSPSAEDSRARAAALFKAHECLQRLGKLNEIDEFREQVIEAHARDWRVLAAAAQSTINSPHYGYLIAGKFERGQHREGGNYVDSTLRDRVRALQLFHQAAELARAAENSNGQTRNEIGQLYRQFGQALHYGGESWRLQVLTDLSELPDVNDQTARGHFWGSSPVGAPVGPDGTPIYYSVPESWQAAANDGERWRWCLVQAGEYNPALKYKVELEFARFLSSQFGVQTLQSYRGFWPVDSHDGGSDEPDRQASIMALDTLGDHETIARLADGVKRFDLPEEFNHVLHYRRIADEALAGDWSSARIALQELAQLYENRRQFPQAAELWRTGIERFPNQENFRKRLAQIVGNWGEFEPISTQPAGQGATVGFRFRNAEQVSLSAKRIDVAQLLADVKGYLKMAGNGRLDWNQVQVGNFGYRLVEQNQQKYLGDEVAQWEPKLDPREKHFDKQITISTPLQQPGAYFLTARLADGNTSHIILWVSDTAIVKKPMEGQSLYYVVDAVTGQPIPRANVEFLGYRQEQTSPRNFRIISENYAEHTSEDGLVTLPASDHNNQMQWIATATTAGGRFAFLGYSRIWSGRYYDAEYRATKVYTITDRPVYRPDQAVKFKFWVRHAQYDQADNSQFAGQTFDVQINDPQGVVVHKQALQADEFGGLSGEWNVPTDAKLGAYSIHVVNHGGGSFRVEEYKKPEFEVTVHAPDEPVKLGDKITARVEASYYFGAPVTDARVKYKITRSAHSQRWYPPHPWDWLYGKGYWWFGYDYAWYPGWARWGCRSPLPWWGWRQPDPPELVAETTADIGPDGTLSIEIDTALAKELHSDEDHRYDIQVEVVDASRRTITGTGQVIVAREPFDVTSWLERGYYRAGDTIEAHAAARTIDGKPVDGQGTATLYSVRYEDDKPVETELQSWPVETSAEGMIDLQLEAATAGQYRLAFAITDEAGHEIEGATIFTIVGEGFDGSDFRFDAIEIIPMKKEYEAGETVELQLNTNRTGATVLLFERPANGVYPAPRVVRISGKSTIVRLETSAKDMPNFFVEAVTVHHGQLHSAMREIHVPPASRVLEVDVTPSAPDYRPGADASAEIMLTDETGEPFEGSTVVAVYDKSVEYISGGSNVADIKEFFWKWRRRHNVQHECNLLRSFANLVPKGADRMARIGIFGNLVEGFNEANVYFGVNKNMRGRGMARRSMVMQAETASAGPGASPMARGASAMALDAVAEGADAQASAELVEPTVRTEFADTALWVAAVTTGKDGRATVDWKMPENLTTWRIRAWSMGHGTRVGQGDAEVVTSKNVIVRLQAPRFFVETDEVVLSAVVHNYLDSAKRTTVRLEHGSGELELLADNREQVVEIPAGGEVRVDWRVKVVREGEAVIRMTALTDEESDAMEMSFPVYVHGMLKQEAVSGVVQKDQQSETFTVTVPSERRPDQTRFEIRYSPTLAGAMVDAIPYLIDYPYGCTEQTLNRFLPAVLAQRTLLEMNLDLAAIRDKQTNLNAQELGDADERAAQWKRYKENPVFDEAELQKIVKAGVKRLTEMQLSDGGWGWFSGWGEHSAPHTTAVVVHGLQIASKNDVALVPGVLENGIEWLKQYHQGQLSRLQNVDEDGNRIDENKPYKRYADNIDALVYMVLAEADVTSAEMRDFLYRDRTHLAVYALATYGMGLHHLNETDKLQMVMRNISQFVEQDDENQTAWLRIASPYWYWYGSEIEAMAYYLKLLVADDPESELAPRLVKYLLNNRKHATYWNSTRDTALVVEAFADFLEATGEAKPDMVVEVLVDGRKQKEVRITPETLFTFDGSVVLAGDALPAGPHQVEIRRQGGGNLYYNAYLQNFTLEDFIEKAGLEVKIERQFYKLTPVEETALVAGDRGQAIDQRVEKYKRELLPNWATVESGDLIEIELVVESKNDYEYILLEDMKAAGFEPVSVRSGYSGNELGAYMELRDNRVALFVSRLMRGKYSVSYRLRAEIPGQFSALPAKISAMYAPELKGNSDEMKIHVTEREE